MRKPEGIMQIKGEAFLADNDPGFGLPDPSILRQYSLSDIRDWLIPYFKNSPFEISIIGDIDPERVVDLASAYLGGLNKREGGPENKIVSRPVGFPAGRQIELAIDTKIDAGVVHVAFLTDDFWDIARTRRLSLLSKVISEKLREVIREELGETYSPYVYHDPSLIFDHYGILHIVVNAKPENHDLIYGKITEIIESLISEKISEKDRDTALGPVLNHLEVYTKTNEYWLNSVMADSYRYPQKLEWARHMTEDYQSITAEELFLLAGKYLRIENRALIRIRSN